MRFNLLRLLRPPLLIYLVSVLCSCLVCYALVHSMVAAHQSRNLPDYLRLETAYLEMEFPKNWLALEWRKSNESGSFYSVELAAADLMGSFSILDERATQTFMTRYDLHDALSVVNFAALRTFRGILARNGNATLRFLRNDTTRLSGLEAHYTIITIRGAPSEDGALHNVTGTFMAAAYQQQFASFSFYSLEERWEESYATLQTILNSTTIRR